MQDSAVSSPNFRTDSLGLAVWLAVRGHPVTLQATGPRFVFGFAPSVALREDVATFNEGRARVEPTEYDGKRIALRKRMDALRGGAR